jgi:putative FmdB family regulatory protein
MPIYAYKCSSCGHAQDVLQRIADEPLNLCTACGLETFSKQLTAPGFQLKGSGWYATDFKGSKAGSTDKADTKTETPGPAADTKAPAAACGAGGCAACPTP